MVVCTGNGRVQKISIPTDGRLFGIPKAWGGSLNWNSEGMGGFSKLEFQGHGGFQIWDLQRGQTRVYSLKSLILWTLLVRK